MDAGDYVPDEVTNAMVRDRLSEADAGEGFLLDGYPRTLPQARSLDRILGNDGGSGIDHVLLVEVPEEELVRRMVARGRVDDTPDVARDRQRIYRETTEPLVAYYGERGLVRRISGFQPIPDVTRQMIVALEGVEGTP
jgi:adenylate kinase